MLSEFIEGTLNCAVADIFAEIQSDLGIRSCDESIDHAMKRDELVSRLSDNIAEAIRCQIEQDAVAEQEHIVQ